MTKPFRTLDDVDVKGKRVLLRVDLNVPMDNGRVTDGTRLERVAPTISEISRIVGSTRSMRVASETLPFSMGTLRSTRSRTRLPRKSAASRVRKGWVMGGRTSMR